MFFPICIKKYKDIVKLYIPAIDMETRAVNYSDALDKARRLIEASIILDEIDKNMISEDDCTAEGIPELLKKKQLEEYLDAQIVFIDYNVKNINQHFLSDITLQIPEHLINDLEKEGIDYSNEFKSILEEILRRKRTFNKVKDWTGKTVKVNSGDYIGEIKSINYNEEKPWDFSIKLKTGIYDSVKIYSSGIDEIDLIPVVMNELGTFHLVNEEGLISLAGKMWWYTGHIDVYLEYDSSAGIEEQKIFDLLSNFNQEKYKIDEYVKNSLAEELKSIDDILLLFQEYDEMDFQKQQNIFFDQLYNKINLWFINISANGDVYMDYNFSNEAGKFNVGVTKNLNNDSFLFVLNNIFLYDMKKN